jgi:hypothetical protein
MMQYYYCAILLTVSMQDATEQSEQNLTAVSGKLEK